MTPTHKIIHADCLAAMNEMEPNTFDAIVTDPPYGLSFMGKEWDHGVPGMEFWTAALRVAKPGAHMLAFGGTRTFHRLTCAIEDAGWEIRDCIMWVYSQGFPKGQDIAWEMHNMACASCGRMVSCDHDEKTSTITSADEGQKACSTGSVSTSKHELRFVRASYLSAPVYACAECGQVLQPFMSEQEAQAIRSAWSKSKAMWPKEPSVEGRGNLEKGKGELHRCKVCAMSHGVFADGAQGWIHRGAPSGDGTIPWQVANIDGSRPSYRPQSIEQLSGQPNAFQLERRAQEVRGWNIALKPAWEPIIVARKPLVGTVAANVREFGTGGINVEACRVGCEVVGWGGGGSSLYDGGLSKEGGDSRPVAGRWPANLIHDGSPDVLDLFPDSKSTGGQASLGAFRNGDIYGAEMDVVEKRDPGYGDSGSAARFFYCAKANKRDRDEGLSGPEVRRSVGDVRPSGDFGERLGPRADGSERKPSTGRNTHPTVKPTDLMRYLCRLVTPPGGTVLDPFCGSGSTGKAAVLEGFNFVGIEKDEASAETARKRVEFAASERGE